MSVPNPFDKGAPAPPDYTGAVETQTRANRANQNTPFASSQWTRGPDGQWTQNVGLNGPLAGLSDTLGNQAASAWSRPMDTGADARNKAEQAIYSRASSRLDPMWGTREHDMQTQLAAQGIDPNSAAYQKASDNFGRNRNDAYTSALMEAIMGGGVEGQREQQMDLQSRFAPLGAMSGLQNLSGMPGIPGAGNYLGAAMAQGQYGMDAAKMNQQFWANVIGGGGQIAAAGAASDERLKADVHRYGVEIAPGVPLASFRYRWEPKGTVHFGVIAQDLEAKFPELVTYRDGYRFVPARFLLT